MSIDLSTGVQSILIDKNRNSLDEQLLLYSERLPQADVDVYQNASLAVKSFIARIRKKYAQYSRNETIWKYTRC